MNYTHIYENLIKTRLENTTTSDLHEVHHILPRALGGKDDKANLIKLTPREHFIAHKLLAKIYGGSMLFAVHLMSSKKPGRVNNRTYAASRKLFAAAQSTDKLEKWARKKGFDSYSHQCQTFWLSFTSGMTIAKIAIEYSANELTISRSIKAHVESNDLQEEYKRILFVRRSEHSKLVRKNEDQSSKQKRADASKRNGWSGPTQKRGGENPAAKKIVFNGVEYDSIKDAELATGVKYHLIRKALKELNNEDNRYLGVAQ